MTDKQIKAARGSLPAWSRDDTPEQKRLREELSCRDMINSILCYNGKRNIMTNRYLIDYIGKLCFDTVQRLVDEQIADFEKATVKRNVFTDGEGVIYNSIVWADEQ